MQTIIELQYKNYTENVIVTEDNKIEVLDLLRADKDILNYELIQQGDIEMNDDFTYEYLLDYSYGKNVGVLRRLEKQLFKMEAKSYFQTDRQANQHYERINNLTKNINARYSKLNNIEKLFI